MNAKLMLAGIIVLGVWKCVVLRRLLAALDRDAAEPFRVQGYWTYSSPRGVINGYGGHTA